MYSRIFNFPTEGKKSFFVFGPRGTGKTYWLKYKLKRSVYINLLKSKTYNDLSASPQRLEKMIPKNYKDWIVIDEVQKIPRLLDEVHRLIEDYKYKFILTGSSARSLKRKGSNLLAGRALTYKTYPLTCKELGNDFSLEKSLTSGNLPSVYTDDKDNPEEYLSSYIKTYIKEEVQQEGLTRNIGAFSRFLETASFSQASLLNISEVARNAAIERKVVENYFTILEDLLIAQRIPVFTKRAKRELISRSKFYFFDVGVFKTIRPMGPLDSPEEAQGPALETLVLQELMALNDYLKLGYDIYFWHTKNKLEVDFILYGKRGIFAFEVKRSRKIKKEDLAGLKAFKADYPEATVRLLYGGDEELWEGNIHIIPIEQALKNLQDLI